MASGSRTVVDYEVSQLLHAMPRRELDAEERQRLLERLLLLERLEDAKLVLQQWLNQQPHSLPLGLLMADLQRRSGALEAARQHLYPLLRLHPVNPDRLQLKLLVDLQDGLGHEALQRVTTHFAARPGGQRLDLGLLLIDLHGQLGMFDAAADVYRQLAKESDEDVRAVLALAMMYQEQGDEPKSNIGSSRHGCAGEMRADRTHLSMIWPTGGGCGQPASGPSSRVLRSLLQLHEGRVNGVRWRRGVVHRSGPLDAVDQIHRIGGIQNCAGIASWVGAEDLPFLTVLISDINLCSDRSSQQCQRDQELGRGASLHRVNVISVMLSVFKRTLDDRAHRHLER